MKPKSILALALYLSAYLTAAYAATNDVVGYWRGTLDTGVAKLRLVFKVSQGAKGELTAKLDSLDQGARDLPMDSVTVSNKTLRMESKLIQGLYVGTLDASGVKATGVWSQGVTVLPLTLEKGQGTEKAEVEKFSTEDLAANKLAAQKIAGTWNGTLAAGGASLRLRVNISKTAAGGATGTMDSLDQGANGIPVSAITLKAGKLRFEVRGIGGVYEGKLDTKGGTLTGDWQQGGQTFPLELKSGATK